VQGQIADLSPDGRYAAIWIPEHAWDKPKRVAIWDLALRKRLGRLTVWSPTAARFTSDSRALAVGAPRGVELWRLSPWKRNKRLAGAAPRSSLRGLTLASDSIVAWGRGKRRFRWWRRSTGRGHTLTAAAGLVGAALGPAGDRLALMTRSSVELWQRAPGRRVRSFPSRRPSAVALSHDGRWLAIASSQDKTVRVLNTRSGAQHARLSVKHAAKALQFGPADRVLLVGGIGLFGRWPFRQGKALIRLSHRHRHLSPQKVRLGSGGRRVIVFGFRHRAVSVWDFAQGTLQADLWPVQGGHWVSRSAAGAVDASAKGRETLITLVRHPALSATRQKATRKPTETVHGWALGWACFERPRLAMDALAGRSLTPPRRTGCKRTP
jgi:WD40 repeat protein